MASFEAMSDTVAAAGTATGGGGAGSFFSRDMRLFGDDSAGGSCWAAWNVGSVADSGIGAAADTAPAAGLIKSSRVLLKLRAAGLCGLGPLPAADLFGLGARPEVEGLEVSEPLRSRL